MAALPPPVFQVCCSDRLDAFGMAFHADWVPWLIAEADRRGLAIEGVVHGTHGWVPTDAHLVRDLVATATSCIVSQRQGCLGVATRVVLCGDTGPVAALFASRGRELAEPSRWRALILEAMVLAKRNPTP